MPYAWVLGWHSVDVTDISRRVSEGKHCIALTALTHRPISSVRSDTLSCGSLKFENSNLFQDLNDCYHLCGFVWTPLTWQLYIMVSVWTIAVLGLRANPVGYHSNDGNDGYASSDDITSHMSDAIDDRAMLSLLQWHAIIASLLSPHEWSAHCSLDPIHLNGSLQRLSKMCLYRSIGWPIDWRTNCR